MDKIIFTQLTAEEITALIKEAVREELASQPTQTAKDGAPPLTQHELCAVLGVTPQTIIRLKKKNKIPWLQIGTAPRYILNDVIEALKNK